MSGSFSSSLILIGTLLVLHGVFITGESNAKRLILISMDGFRWNYMERTDTPNLDRIVANGVRATNGLTAAFITKTFPNHFTLATGMWEESHGIVANNMFDPALNQTFNKRNTTAVNDPAWFDVGAEPIWVTNQRQGGLSAAVMWIGAGAAIKGVHPYRYMPYNHSVKNESKIDKVIGWFKDPNKPINLALIYFDQPDSFGHWFGPESKQVTRMIGGMDGVIGYLLDQMDRENMLKDTNLIVTSDHGFVTTPKDKVIDLDKIIDPSFYHLSEPSPVASVWPHEDHFDEIFENLTRAAQANGHFTVYKKSMIPTHFHYTHNRRIGPIQLVADESYSFTAATFPYYNVGDHGYNNRLKSMRPFFVAMGPSFKKNYAVDTFQNVDVYPLMCHLLDVEPASNNGSMDTVSKLLKTDRSATTAASAITTDGGSQINTHGSSFGVTASFFVWFCIYNISSSL